MSPKWKHLEQVALLDAITEQSFSKPQVLFKHSTRCSISTMAMNRLLRLEDAFYQQADFYYLDLIAHRDVSAAIAERYHVHHESPQNVPASVNYVPDYTVHQCQ